MNYTDNELLNVIDNALTCTAKQGGDLTPTIYTINNTDFYLSELSHEFPNFIVNCGGDYSVFMMIKRPSSTKEYKYHAILKVYVNDVLVDTSDLYGKGSEYTTKSFRSNTFTVNPFDRIKVVVEKENPDTSDYVGYTVSNMDLCANIIRSVSFSHNYAWEV